MADCRAGMTWLLRLVAAVVGLLLPVVPAQVHAVETPVGVSAYTYDSQHRPALLTDTATERGPPASYGRGSVHVADYHWSCGDQARPEGATSGATTACNAPAEFVQVTRAAGRTQPSVQGDAGALLSLGRSDVAANGGRRSVAIGEDIFNRVEPFAKKIGADTYKADPTAPREMWMKNNRDWIRKQMDDEYAIYDCGPAPGRSNFPSPTSPYYKMELDEIGLRNYPYYFRVPVD